VTGGRQPVLLIVGRLHDPHIERVLPLLQGRGLSVVRFDPAWFPARVSVALRLGAQGLVRAVLRLPSVSASMTAVELDGCEQMELDLACIDLVWNRVRSRSVSPETVDPRYRLWVEENCTRFLGYLYELIRCPWIPYRPHSSQAQFTRDAAVPGRALAGQRYVDGDIIPSAENKLHQLMLAHRLGFLIPETLVTNSPADFQGFYAEHSGNLVSKKLVDLVISPDGGTVVPFTHAVQEHDLMRSEALRCAPVIFQQKLVKKIELRVTVIAEQVFAAAIDSGSDSRQSVDWRHYPTFDLGRFYSPYTLPAVEQRRCVALVQALGQCFGAIDLVLHPELGYIFLEVNPNGQWGWIEEYTGLPIASAFADLLVAKAYAHFRSRAEGALP